mgnify:CR=1 FL=1
MKIGEQILYPMHGAGEVTDISTKDFYGEDIEYATLEIKSSGMVLQFPVKNAETLKIRPIAEKERFLNALTGKIDNHYMDSSNWNKRYQAILEKMKMGAPEDMAEVLINLKAQDSEKSLSSGERQLFHQALEIVASELMISADMSYDEAQTLIQEELEEVLFCETQQKSSESSSR